jgi:hypothetical protein
MSTVPQLLHPAWCDPRLHINFGAFDQRCISETQVVHALVATPDDPGDVEISVEQGAERPGGVGPWQPILATVQLNPLREGGADLTPQEARRVARLLLAAADIAEGVAVTW